MSQTEDTELRDLVIEALEKNGSLAKIRALLRANVFLAFENECENRKQNVCLDNILRLPEGVLALSIIHEFLEFCNLKNTLFVYMAESRQKKEYVYDGQKILEEKLSIHKPDNIKEPVLITLLKYLMKQNPNKYSGDNKDEENCTYIVHTEDSGSTTSNSQSDTSTDEKNKLHLRLHLDNSDTDTSSDSARDKSSSEYIPSEHIVQATNLANDKPIENTINIPSLGSDAKYILDNNLGKQTQYLYDLKLINSSSNSDSTSYIDLKPFMVTDNKLSNITEVSKENSEKDNNAPALQTFSNVLSNEKHSPVADPISPGTLSSVSSLSSKNEEKDDKPEKLLLENSPVKLQTSEAETEYTLDFSSSPVAKDAKNDSPKRNLSPEFEIEDYVSESPNNNKISMDSQHSHSSQSSISISDVADLISEKSIVFSHQVKNDNNTNNKSKPLSSSSNSKKISNLDSNKVSDDSGDFTDSPVPSLSNLSLEIHSE